MMNHQQRIQLAIDYIEQNLAEELTPQKVSQQVFCSLSYLHRVFYFVTGYTVKDYIRQRRLSKAAVQLANTNLTILDLAIESGYESYESFSRAFKKQFELSPDRFRQQKPNVSLTDVITSAQVSQAIESNRIPIDIDSLLFHQREIAGFQISTDLSQGKHTSDISLHASKVFENKLLDQYFAREDDAVFGIFTNMTDQSEFDYTIGCDRSYLTTDSAELSYHTIPTSRYHRFTVQAIDQILPAWQFIYGSWFPLHANERTKGYDFEIYYPDRVEIYIPMNH